MNRFLLGGIVYLAWGTILFIVLRSVWKRLKKFLFFRSSSYLTERNALRGFAKRLDELLKSPEPIGQEGIQSFLDESKTCVAFFKGLDWAKTDQSFMQDYLPLTEAAEKLHKHDVSILAPLQGKLKAFAQRFQALLSTGATIGEPDIQAFVESGKSVIQFFSKNPSWIEDEASRWGFEWYDHATSILLQHDAEILFGETVAQPLRDLLAGPEFISRDKWQLLCNRYQALAENLSRYKWIRPGSDAAMGLFEEGENRIAEHNSQIAAEIRFEKTFTAPFKTLLANDRYIARTQWFSLCQAGLPQVTPLAQTPPLRPETTVGLQLFGTAKRRVEQSNREFLEREMNRCAHFFDTLAKYPLDRQQRECCIVDEDAALVIAGAGSGKTSVIMAKVVYLRKRWGIPPEAILLISFTNKAAQEMTNRIAACLGKNSVAASTFHKFGKTLIEQHDDEGDSPADPDFLEHVIHEVMTGEADFVDDDYSLLVEFVDLHLSHLAEPFPNESGAAPLLVKGKKIAFAGERVKSLEELLIANFLFLKGVRYEYEKPYSKPYDRERGKRAYRPDFYLPDYDVYIEHYGVDENGEPPSQWPAIEKEKYKGGMKWKRELHAAAGNRYIESFSWWHRKGELLERLARELQANGVAFKSRTNKEILGILRKKEKKKLESLEKLLATFIRLYKSNNYPDERFDFFIAQRDDNVARDKRNKTFLELARRVYRLYERKLAENHLYDFNDMINRATEIVRHLPCGSLPYKYVIVDEYQDASVARMKLLKAVLENTGAHLFCVGDDWQSIYRFAGSDLSLFTEFGKYFGDAFAQMRIENTYRNSQELLDIMSRFVLRNPGQLSKTLKSSLHTTFPVRVMWFEGKSREAEVLDQTIGTIAVELAGKSGEVLLLGRNQYDEKPVRDSKILKARGGDGVYVAPSLPNITFRFLTVHKSKGLEGDYVILLNAQDDVLGFPTRIADDPILQLVQHGDETFEYAEERRLFYVALTRTRNWVFVLAPAKGYSPFVAELLALTGQQPPAAEMEKTKNTVFCPKCQTGELTPRRGPRGWFTICSNAPECDWSAPGKIGPETPRCPSCGGFLVERRGNQLEEHVFLGCTNYPYCKHTKPIEGQSAKLDSDKE